MARRRIEMIEEYLMPDDRDHDYQYYDNHGVLVRCKDCLYFCDISDMGTTDMCSFHAAFGPDGEIRTPFYTTPEGYCSWAERKEDDA